jgi:hypothetical protein
MASRDVLAPDHLYTWVDVDEYFARLATQRQWPSWLLEVDAYWDAVEFVVDGAVPADQLWRWLAECLGPLTADSSRGVIFLESLGSVGESASTGEAVLLVHVRAADFLLDLPPRRSAAGRASIGHRCRPCPGGFRMTLRSVPSVRSGTGRTLHCLALARNCPAVQGRVFCSSTPFEAPGKLTPRLKGSERISLD